MACIPHALPARGAPAAASASIAARSREPSQFSACCLRLSWSWLKEANMRQLCKGNVAVVKGAVLAGCRAYYGYPITPASEIAEAAAYYLPQVGGTFLQAESEVAAINMIYGAASAGIRAMTASSGPGISLMQEGISYLAGSELPCVIADIMRGGPGLGNIAPGAERLFRRGERRRPWKLPQLGDGSRFGAGDGRVDEAGF